MTKIYSVHELSYLLKGTLVLNRIVDLNIGIHTLEVDAAEYAKGLYIIKINNINSGEKFNAKFMKE